MPVAYEPLLRWRKARARNHEGIWGGPSRIARDRPELVEGLLDRVREEGPLSASEVTAPRERTPGAMWDWSDEKPTVRLCTTSRRPDLRLSDARPERDLYLERRSLNPASHPGSTGRRPPVELEQGPG
jgi:hypothetical protein